MMVTNEYYFPKFDDSYWKVRDKVWMEERKQQWADIETRLNLFKSGKGKTAIKNYFLKGRLPDWDKFREYNNHERHVDLMMFLWLHPSVDRDFLIQLRDEYINSVVVRIEDIEAGFSNFLSCSIINASVDFDLSKPPITEQYIAETLHADGHNELLFDVLTIGLDQPYYDLQFLYLDNHPPETLKFYPLRSLSFTSIISMGKWLCIKELHPINKGFLYQYDAPLEWWYKGAPQNEAYFSKHAQPEAARECIKEALYRIHHFDAEDEGDTCRSKFVHKIRKILDDREFIPEFKQMWLDVKAGKIEVKDPWKR